MFIRTSSDSGKPVALDATTPQGRAFQEIASAVVEQVGVANSLAAQEISIQ